MNIKEFKNSIQLIIDFTAKLDKELIPYSFQKIIIKAYANTLKINLTDRMINDII